MCQKPHFTSTTVIKTTENLVHFILRTIKSIHLDVSVSGQNHVLLTVSGMCNPIFHVARLGFTQTMFFPIQPRQGYFRMGFSFAMPTTNGFRCKGVLDQTYLSVINITGRSSGNAIGYRVKLRQSSRSSRNFMHPSFNILLSHLTDDKQPDPLESETRNRTPVVSCAMPQTPSV